MTNSDYDAFTEIFQDYVSHLIKNPNSLLARVYGIYTVRMKNISPLKLIVMGNTKRTADDSKSLQYLFDLKGSMVSRETKIKRGSFKPTTCLKDVNLKKLKEDRNVRSVLVIIFIIVP